MMERKFSMSKKILLVLLIFVMPILFVGCKENFSTSNKAEETTNELIIEESTEAAFSVTEAKPASDKNDYSFRNACFYCVETDELLFQYNYKEKLQPASLAKILTAATALFYVDPETEFTVGTELSLVQPRSSLCLIKKGHRLTLSQLIEGMLIASGNDAAYTIAVNVARTVIGEKLSDSEAVSGFSELMNSFARLIGMKNSHFTSPDGYDNENQYTTAEDLLVLTRYALTVPAIKETVSLSQKHVVFKSGENITWHNTNKLLSSGSHYNKYAIGMKTGTTNAAGNCLISAFEKNDLTYISVICGAETSDSRYKDTNRLFNTYSE